MPPPLPAVVRSCQASVWRAWLWGVDCSSQTMTRTCHRWGIRGEVNYLPIGLLLCPVSGVSRSESEGWWVLTPSPRIFTLDTSTTQPPKGRRPYIIWGMGGGGGLYWGTWLVPCWSCRCAAKNHAAKSVAHSGHLSQSWCISLKGGPTPVICHV